MSFDSYNKKPKLVETKLVKYFNDKFKQKEIKAKIEQEDLIKQGGDLKGGQNDSQPLYKKIGTNIWEFFKENYGFFILSFLIILLLYVRYIEVSRRKEKMKNIINQINEQQKIKSILKKQKQIKEDESETNLNTADF
jgi:hypothetical protein